MSNGHVRTLIDLDLSGIQYDQSGKLGFDEFKELWDSLREWKGVFKKYDADKSGHFSSYELRQALQATGDKLNISTWLVVIMEL